MPTSSCYDLAQPTCHLCEYDGHSWFVLKGGCPNNAPDNCNDGTPGLPGQKRICPCPPTGAFSAQYEQAQQDFLAEYSNHGEFEEFQSRYGVGTVAFNNACLQGAERISEQDRNAIFNRFLALQKQLREARSRNPDGADCGC